MVIEVGFSRIVPVSFFLRRYYSRLILVSYIFHACPAPQRRCPTKTIWLEFYYREGGKEEEKEKETGKRFSKGGIWRYSSSFWSFGDERDRRSRVYLTHVPPLRSLFFHLLLILFLLSSSLESFTHETSYNPSFRVARLVFPTLETTTAGKTLAKHPR